MAGALVASLPLLVLALVRQTIKYTIPYPIILGLMAWGYAFVFPQGVP